jgi:apolipoprotein D and lipocalin family protein
MHPKAVPMKTRALMTVLLAAASLMAGCASMGGGGGTAVAPEPAKPIDVARFFTGRWYEIARTPLGLTKNCVAGTTDYTPGPDGSLIDHDACRMDTPDGKVRHFDGPLTILNPGMNNKVRVDYTLFGFVPVHVTYWMLDHGDDYQWFLVATPDFKNVSMFTRDPRPPQSEVDRLTARAKALGYDTSKWEFPAEFAPGQS